MPLTAVICLVRLELSGESKPCVFAFGTRNLVTISARNLLLSAFITSICLVRLFGLKIKYSLGIGLTNLVTADVLPIRRRLLSALTTSICLVRL